MPAPPPITLNLNSRSTPGDALELALLDQFAAAGQSHARHTRLARARRRATLLPPGVRPDRSYASGAYRVELATGDGWTVLVVRWPNRSASVTVTAGTSGRAERLLAACVAGAKASVKEDGRTRIGFWHLGSLGAERSERRVRTIGWEGIRGNYADGVAAVLDQLMAATPEQLAGRLLLLHGPPGTGKTTVLRALADAWRGWCQVDYVLDPEQMFTTPGYLLSAALDDDELAGRRRLLVLEDCDELLRAGAKQETGQALSRLLNLTDGLLAQGTDLLVAITTNEPLRSLHPAVVRPGRCLAQVEVGRLSPEEARRWLGRSVPVPADGVSLAELFALRDGRAAAGGAPAARVGQYL